MAIGLKIYPFVRSKSGGTSSAIAPYLVTITQLSGVNPKAWLSTDPVSIRAGCICAALRLDGSRCRIRLTRNVVPDGVICRRRP